MARKPKVSRKKQPDDVPDIESGGTDDSGLDEQERSK